LEPLYRYTTIVQSNGIIKIPEISSLENHEIEVIILDKNIVPAHTTNKSFTDFSEKWKGLLKNSETSADFQTEKIDYLRSKHS